MKNTRKILFSAALLSSGLTMAQTTTVEKLPNVIYIMADDLGIGDLGCYGQRQIKTPNIDGIAQNGMKFMQHYSGSTVSAPSRCDAARQVVFPVLESAKEMPQSEEMQKWQVRMDCYMKLRFLPVKLP